MTKQGTDIVLGVLRGRAEMLGRQLGSNAEELYMETLGPWSDTFAVNVVRTALKEPGLPDDEKLRMVARALQGATKAPERPKEDREAGLRAAKAFSEGFRKQFGDKPIPENLDRFLTGWLGRAERRAKGEEVPYGKVEMDSRKRREIEAEVEAHQSR